MGRLMNNERHLPSAITVGGWRLPYGIRRVSLRHAADVALTHVGEALASRTRTHAHVHVRTMGFVTINASLHFAHVKIRNRHCERSEANLVDTHCLSTTVASSKTRRNDVGGSTTITRVKVPK